MSCTSTSRLLVAYPAPRACQQHAGSFRSLSPASRLRPQRPILEPQRRPLGRTAHMPPATASPNRATAACLHNGDQVLRAKADGLLRGPHAVQEPLDVAAAAERRAAGGGRLSLGRARAMTSPGAQAASYRLALPRARISHAQPGRRSPVEVLWRVADAVGTHSDAQAREVGPQRQPGGGTAGAAGLWFVS